MRFVLDEDVDARAVRTLLLEAGHDVWTIVEAGLGGADDDAVSTYADDRNAALITHDKGATLRRRRFTFGQHVHLNCSQLDGAAILGEHLNELLGLLGHHQIGVFEIRASGVTLHSPRYEHK